MDAQHPYNHIAGPWTANRTLTSNGKWLMWITAGGKTIAGLSTIIDGVSDLDRIATMTVMAAAPTMFDALLKWAEFVGPDDGNLHCIECDRIGDPDPTVVMEHESDCDLGNAIKQARGTT